jgi:hypothetical protein
MILSHEEVERMLDELQDGLPRMMQRYDTPEAFWPVFSGSVDVILGGCPAEERQRAEGRVERMRESAVRAGMRPEAESTPGDAT